MGSYVISDIHGCYDELIRMLEKINLEDSDTLICAGDYVDKNFMANFEYAYADGYNGARTISSNKAEGFYTTAGYKITPRIQVLARYDNIHRIKTSLMI